MKRWMIIVLIISLCSQSVLATCEGYRCLDLEDIKNYIYMPRGKPDGRVHMDVYNPSNESLTIFRIHITPTWTNDEGCSIPLNKTLKPKDSVEVALIDCFEYEIGIIDRLLHRTEIEVFVDMDYRFQDDGADHSNSETISMDVYDAEVRKSIFWKIGSGMSIILMILVSAAGFFHSTAIVVYLNPAAQAFLASLFVCSLIVCRNRPRMRNRIIVMALMAIVTALILTILNNYYCLWCIY